MDRWSVIKFFVQEIARGIIKVVIEWAASGL